MKLKDYLKQNHRRLNVEVLDSKKHFLFGQKIIARGSTDWDEFDEFGNYLNPQFLETYQQAYLEAEVIRAVTIKNQNLLILKLESGLYYDEDNEELLRYEDLVRKFDTLKSEGELPEEFETFNDYYKEILSKNGSVTQLL
jgi:hypothetical protein